LSALEHPRRHANSEIPKGDPPEFQRAGLHARLGAAILEWRKPTGRPASKWAFLEAGCHVVSVAALLAKSCQHVLCRLPDTWRR
jgi:hypothetical protein